jgi:Flp pilus assembly pilin Flp
LRRGTTSALHGDHPSRPRRSAEAGQGLIEYGLILAIMAVVCVVSLLFFGDQLSSLLSLVASAV